MSLRRIAAAAERGDRRALAELERRVAANPVHRALFVATGAPDRSVIERRCSAFRDLYAAWQSLVCGLGGARPVGDALFDTALPIAEYVLSAAAAIRRRPLVIGLAGGSGVGKTTLASTLALCLERFAGPEERATSASIDDFYFSRAERLRRGHRWRGPPGTHDLERIAHFLEKLDAGRSALRVPRYSLAEDRPLPDRVVTGPVRFCFFEGAIVGGVQKGYEALAARLDFLIYCNAPIDRLEVWRLGREQRMRRAGRGGYAESAMHAFWREALRPMIEHWVLPTGERADLVLDVGARHRVLDARLRRPLTMSAIAA